MSLKLAIGLLLAFAPGILAAGEEILTNGGFEDGAEKSFPGWQPVWPRNLPEAPRFTRVTREPHGGSASAEIRATGSGGYSSLTQVISNPPAGAKTAKLEAWVRADKGTQASVLLIFFDPDAREGEKMVQSPRVSGTGEWRKLTVEALVPAFAKRWMVRCGVAGAGAAAFDDVSLTYSADDVDPVEVALVVGRGNYFVVPAAAGGRASITFSVPFPFGGQTPLAMDVDSDPPGAVASLEVKKDRENRPLRVTVQPPAGKKSRIKLRANTFVLLRDRPIPEVSGVKPAPANKVPPEVRLHLRAAPGVDVSDPKVREAAGRLAKTDLKTLLGGVVECLRTGLKYDGGGNQGAKQCLASGRAVCTGYANVCAAILISAGVPARILACTQTEGKLQEHYIVEAWGNGPGWLRIESTMAAFPWADSRNLILRVIYPDAPRSPANVPLYFDLQGTSSGGFDVATGDGTWQSAETIGSFLLDRYDLEKLEAAAAKEFEGLAAKPAHSGKVELVPSDLLPDLGERGRSLLEALDRYRKP